MLGVEHVAVPEQVAKTNPLLNSDLFDAEDSSDEERGPAPSSPQPTQTNRSSKPIAFSDDDDSSDSGVNDPFVRNESGDNAGSDGEERTSPTPPDVSERAKSKRKPKAPREKKPRRAKKAEVQEIHSNSQRIVRESSLRLPYHKPAKKSLDDFFNRKPSSSSPFLKPVPLRGAKKLNGGLSAHKNSNGYSTKHSKSPSNNNKLQLDTKSSLSSTQDSDSLKLPSTPVEEFPIVANWLKNIEPAKADDPNGAKNGDMLSEEQIKAEPSTDKLENSEDIVQNSEEVEDSLNLTGILSQTQEEESQEYAKDDCIEKAGEGAGKTEPDSDEIASNAPAATPTTGVNENPAGGDSQVQDIDKESSQLVNGQTVSDQVNNDAPISSDKEQEPTATQPEDPQAIVDEKPQVPTQNDKELPVTPAPGQLQGTMSAAKRRQMLVEASLEKLKGFTPKLEGSPEAVIDLEGSDDDETPGPVLNPGLKKLMDRFAVHTKKAAAKKKRQVEVSVVSKEVDNDGKEDLKYDTVLTTLDGEEEEDPLLKVPGAKLLKLKDNLQVKMRLIREQARKKRKELYRLDNEELLEDGDEEDEEKKGKDEAELTDQTDTDYDPDEDNIKDDDDDEDDDEEMDEDDYEEPARRKCEFGDEEAEVDEDDEEDEYDEEEDEEEGEPKKDDDKAEMASGEESSDEEDDMGRRKITPTRVKRKKKLVLDEDDDDEDEEKMVLKIPEDDEPEVKESDARVKGPSNEPSESSRLSIAGSNSSSAKISTDTKNSFGFNLNGSKTMEMFDSNTRNSILTSDGDKKTTGDMSPTVGETTGFTWSALKKSKEDSAVKKNKEDNKDDQTSDVGNLKLDSASNSLDTSFEMFGSVIPGHQPGGGMRHAGKSSDAAEPFMPFSKQKSIMDSEPKSTPKLSELTMPVEDSQLLFRDESPLPSPGIHDSQRTGESQSFHFSFEEDETQSQFLDENGFLNVRPSVPKPKPVAKKLFNSSQPAATPNNMDELLGLCSGQFTGTQEPRASSPKGFGGTGPFSQITKGLGETQGGMDELLQLCSGTFAKTQAQGLNNKETNLAEENKKEGDDGSEASFHLVSDNESFHSNDEKDENEDKDKFKGLSSDEGEGGKKQGEEVAGEEGTKKRRRIKMIGSSDEEGEDEKKQVKVKKFKMFSQKKSKLIKKHFVENEAELSGSEYDSDEFYDAEDLADELEDDAGADQEDLGDEEELRDQVNKVHMKAVEDDDARRLRIYKELLLPDGDLHSDNKGRQRQFKWRNLNNYEDSMGDMFGQNSDGEVEDADNDEDTQWRMKRFEREQWLKENKQKQPDQEDEHEEVVAEEENSQFVKFMKTAVQKNRKIKAPAIPAAASNTNQQQDKEKDKRVSTPKAIKTRAKFHGSFLHRKDEVAKIAANTMANPNGPRMSRNFVFQAVSPDAQKSEAKRPQVKRSSSVSGVSGSMSAPKAKRPRMERSQSIFNHL
ncbi:uncharacterized protein [Amphiura filiformis]|uniref:uncharacterized protein n=1 Tax=Amphiura filiformis TaxID=82378 RepID=UPI003B21FE7E